ncbi:uncharacterized protein LOC135331518 [Halichondria panicea]|uniref:uncharacterized protein LOC135331518 n=1 Tax=Halichondria panicea TaxID=6063 RepID=UPI00312B8379
MDLVQGRMKSCLLSALVLAGVGILAAGYYLRVNTIEVKMSRKRMKYILPNGIQSLVLTVKDVQDVQSFVFFVGYPRSGHSVLASMMDAHPNAILAHEFNLFPKLDSNHSLRSDRMSLYKALYKNSYKQSTQGWRSMNPAFQSKGYGLTLNNSLSWQGRYRRLRVIGDKSGGITARLYRSHGRRFTTLYKQLSELVKVPIKVIHVVRNPYDMLATRLLYKFSDVKREKAHYTPYHPLNNPSNVTKAMMSLYSEAEAVLNMTKALQLDILEVHNVDFIRNPKEEMGNVCKFIGLQCSSGYLNMVARSTFNDLSITRRSVLWSDEARHFMKTKMLLLPFFKRYSYESSY